MRDKTAYVINVKDDVELKEVIITLNENDDKKIWSKIKWKRISI